MNKRNDWEFLLKKANEDLKRIGYSIKVTDYYNDGCYTCEFYKNGVSVMVYAENYYEDELTDIIIDAWHYALNYLSTESNELTYDEEKESINSSVRDYIMSVGNGKLAFEEEDAFPITLKHYGKNELTKILEVSCVENNNVSVMTKDMSDGMIDFCMFTEFNLDEMKKIRDCYGLYHLA